MAAHTTYTTTRHGVTRRMFGDSPMCEISLLRPGNRHHTYQGMILATDNGWRAYGANRNGTTTDLGTFADWLDAETALLTRRTGTRSAVTWDGPRPATRRRPATNTCDICGWDYPAGGTCQRPELHWTAESIAAENAHHHARHHAAATA